MKFRLFLLALIALAVPVLAFAQDAPPTPDSVFASAITALVPVVVMVIVWGVRALAPKIPPILLPILATAIGAASSFVSGLQGATGGSLVKGAALGVLAVFLREILTTLGLDVSVKKVGVLFLVVVGLVGLNACASTGPVKQGAYVGLSAAKEGLNLVSTTLLQVECGKPVAPQPPACVPSDRADVAWKAIGEAAEYGKQAEVLVRALPANLDSTTPPAQVADLIGKVWTAIWQVTALFHHDGAQGLSKDLTALSHK